MKRTLCDYIEIIKKLPLKDKYTKEELLIEEFLMDKKERIEIYYAPHNEYLNPRAKVFIVGITPGFQQMSTAIATARKELESTNNIEKIQYACKVEARFSGPLRKNIITMLDGIGLNDALHIGSSSSLFAEKDNLLHTISLIPYPAFKDKKNYTGHSPKLIKSDFLMRYVYENFIEEFDHLENRKNLLIIPLGKAVEEILTKLEKEGAIGKNQILKGFPHPSGENGGRIAQFESNKYGMSKFLNTLLDRTT